MHVERKLAALGLVLPPPLKVPPGVRLPFQFVRIVGQRAIISGHGPQGPDGPSAAAHARSAVGLAELPFDIPVEIEGEVEIAG
jgi:hypothetical protein